MSVPSESSRSSKRRVRYLTFDDLNTIAYELAVHFFADWLGAMPTLEFLGGSKGVSVVEGILALPRQTAGGRPAYPGLFDKAAVLLRSITLDHPFVDGNKRMGIASALAFLSANDQIVVASDQELVGLALAVATGHRKDLEFLAEWMRQRGMPFDELLSALRENRLDELTAKFPGGPALRRPLLELLVERLRVA